MENVLTATALASLRAWIATFPAKTRQKGKAYYHDNHVVDVWAEDEGVVCAEVEGQETYQVTLAFMKNRWSSFCSCPMESDCKHVYAASLTWIAAAETGDAVVGYPRDLKSAPPPPVSSKVVPFSGRASAFPPSPAPKKKVSFREQWAPVLAEKLGRPLTSEEGHRLGQLSALYTEFKNVGGVLYPDMLRRHNLSEFVPDGTPSYAALFTGWWDYRSPPADPWALWQIIAFQAERAGQPLPEVFRPLTDTRKIHAAHHERLLKEELALWRRSLTGTNPAVPPPGNHLGTGLGGLRARFDSTGGLFLEVRPAADKPWKPPTQAWVKSLGDAHPADFEHLSAPEAALALALATESRDQVSFSGKQALPPEIVESLLRSTLARAVIFLPGERPFAIETEPLVAEAVVSATSQHRLDLRLVAPDGADASSAALLVHPPQPLYFFADRIWHGPPPLPAKTLSVDALTDPTLLSGLRTVGLRLPASLNLEIRQVVLRPLLRCWLGDRHADYEQDQFRAQLLARAEDPPCAQVWAGAGGWQWTSDGAPRKRGPDDPHFIFDLAPAQAVAARFADFRLGWYDWDKSWGRPGSKNFPGEFAAWHASLPPGTDVELSPELAALIGPPLRAHLDFSALPVDGGRDWFDLTIALRVEDSTLTAEEIALLLKARGQWVRLPARGWRRLEIATEAGDASAALDRLGLGAAEVFAGGKPATHRLHALQLAGEASAFAARDASLAAALRERAAALSAVPPPPLPAGLAATLRPYQEEGYHFLAHLSAHGFGGVLADDMGLGKTVQTLAWLLHLAPTRPAGKKNAFRALVVCPKSVTHGWLAETERFASRLKATPFTPAVTAAPLAQLGAHLLIANYTQLRLHAEWFQSGAWDAVVLDEGQFIKNPASQAAVVARALATRHRLVLTGTPVENRLTDLWSLFAFAQPGLLGAQAAFKRQYPETDPAALARLRRRVHHFLLRRTKTQAAPDLPSRTEDELVVELEPAQRKLYDAELKRARAQLLGIETARALDAVRFNVLASLLRLRQICCHPALVDPAHADLPSAKLDALLERLEALRDEGHQVLVFSQFVGMLEIIRERLAAAGIGHLTLTGASENRAELVNTFQSDKTKTVFLLSLKAAGFGLNLTAASYAILYDPWWNPAAEAQAIDRTHRIGQTRPVIAYRLLAENTIEQKIRALQKEKASLAAAVIQEESLASVLDLDSLRKILE